MVILGPKLKTWVIYIRRGMRILPVVFIYNPWGSERDVVGFGDVLGLRTRLI